MRIVRIKLKPDMKELLGEIAQQYSIEDTGFAEDIFCLLRNKGSGLPTDDRIDKMAEAVSQRTHKSATLIRMTMRKRKHVLGSLTKLPYFKALCLECAAEPHLAVGRLLDTFRAITRKTQHAQCRSCQYLKSCDFGKQYGEIVSDVSKVVDSSYATKIHANCPERPALDQINAFADAIEKMQQLSPATPQGQAALSNNNMAAAYEQAANALENAVEGTDVDNPVEDGSVQDLDAEEMAENVMNFGGSGAGKNAANLNQGTSTGAAFAQTSEQLIKQISAQQLALFDLGRQLAAALSKATKGKYKPAPTVDDRQKTETMRSVSDVGSATSVEHAAADDIFDAKVGKKTLQVRKFEKKEDKKFLLYNLVDVSGSMAGLLHSSNFAMLTRGNVASTLVASLLHRVKEDGGLALLRFFSDNPGPKLRAERDSQFDAMIRTVVRQDYNGGGTSIVCALRRAFDDIIAAKDEIAKCEILLVTDADDYIDEDFAKWVEEMKKKHRIVLNTLDVNPASKSSYGNGAAMLKRLSNKYLKANPTSLTLSNLVDLVK